MDCRERFKLNDRKRGDLRSQDTIAQSIVNPMEDPSYDQETTRLLSIACRRCRTSLHGCAPILRIIIGYSNSTPLRPDRDARDFTPMAVISTLHSHARRLSLSKSTKPRLAGN